uniref:Uncharacterized protein n=1 Tax=Trachysalambria curvirostris majanivirus TaxID=2984281 RepID=A0A9C7C925_9VIRU|nr:MAG: hypothetical protein [Trachysalambria curvirostris majanivirus]
MLIEGLLLVILFVYIIYNYRRTLNYDNIFKINKHEIDKSIKSITTLINKNENDIKESKDSLNNILSTLDDCIKTSDSNYEEKIGVLKALHARTPYTYSLNISSNEQGLKLKPKKESFVKGFYVCSINIINKNNIVIKSIDSPFNITFDTISSTLEANIHNNKIAHNSKDTPAIYSKYDNIYVYIENVFMLSNKNEYFIELIFARSFSYDAEYMWKITILDSLKIFPTDNNNNDVYFELYKNINHKRILVKSNNLNLGEWQLNCIIQRSRVNQI